MQTIQLVNKTRNLCFSNKKLNINLKRKQNSTKMFDKKDSPTKTLPPITENVLN